MGSSGSCSAAGRAAEALSATPTAPSNWTDAAWRDEILAWASTALAAAGRRVVGPVEQPHIRPTSPPGPPDLASSGIRASIEHGDLHGGNILLGPNGVRFYDWGDATVAHPFGTLTTTLRSIAYHTGRDTDDAELARLRDAYTEAWTDMLPRSALAEVADLATDLGHIGKSSAWARAMDGVDPAAMGEYGGGAVGWLIDFADRLERRLTR